MTAEAFAHQLNGRRTGKGWMARCPAHDDHTPSLSINDGRDGRTVLNCYAGCSYKSILEAMHLTVTDLSPPTGPTRHRMATDTSRELRAIRAILGRKTDPFAMRAVTLLHRFPHWSPQTLPAKLLYVLIAKRLDERNTVDAKRSGRRSHSVTYAELAKTMACSDTSIKRYVKALHRTGPLPLLDVSVGTRGRATSFSFIEDPSRYADAQAVSKERRHAKAEQQRAAMRAAGFTAEAAESLWIKKRETWMVSDRAPVVLIATPIGATASSSG